MGFIGELEEVIYYVSFFLGENLVIRFVGRINFIVYFLNYVNWDILKWTIYVCEEDNFVNYFV